MSEPTTTTSSAPVHDDSVMAYLQRVANASATLCIDCSNPEPVPPETMIEESGSSRSNDLIRQIAKQLLQACDPNVLSLPLPAVLVQVEREKQRARGADRPLLMDPEEEEQDRIPDWKTTRADYLRCLLRGMSPIALDVAAQICSNLLLRQTDGIIVVPMETAVAAFILFSKWLPIAPQLSPLVSDLFTLDAYPCPLEFGTEKNDDGVQLLVAEAAHGLYEFYAKRSEHSTMNEWWNWGHLFTMLVKENDDVSMEDSSSSICETRIEFDVREAIRWHAARAIGFLIDLRPAAFAAYLDRLEVRADRVPWVPHPWIVDKEEERAQFRFLKGLVSFWDSADEFNLVSSEQVRRVVSLSPLLVHVGEGVVFVKNDSIGQLVIENDVGKEGESRRNRLILTSTTSENLSLLGAAMCTDPNPLPILVCGPPGSGKSSLVRELAHCCCPSANDLLELHVDEETDSKTLIGSYTTADIPGEFTWRPGALTQAVRSGKWVLLEDVDSVPMEIQAAIIQLLEDRMLPLGGCKFERCHPKFRFFGTCTTIPRSYNDGTSNKENRALRLAGKKLLNPSLWRKVHVRPMALSELKEVGESLWPSLPAIVTEAALKVLKALDGSGRSDISDSGEVDVTLNTSSSSMTQYCRMVGRHASVRDFLKLLSRISHTVSFEHNISFVTEAQRTLCLAETVDVFASSCPFPKDRRDFVAQVAAPAWGVTAELALNYMEARQPSITRGSNYTEIGRARIPHASNSRLEPVPTEMYAQTNFSLRLMESIGVCIRENEPTLLVGETGCGKTAVLQHLSNYAGRDLIVQNLSLQTDSTDLLGGYRPIEIAHIARKVYLEFVELFVSTFSRKQNAEFLDYTLSVLRKKHWKKLAQCFIRAASLGLAKIKDSPSDSFRFDSSIPGQDEWKCFAETAEQFERQRLACDSGLAFAFTEGALVDAIQTGKWVLLDEINLASSETLQRLCGLLDNCAGSVTLTERGDSHALRRHPDFRLFAAMNPATDAGKKDLPASIRSRFSELYVDELVDAVELRTVAAQYLRDVVSPLEYTETTARSVDIYLRCRELAEGQLVDASGHRPRYTMRTMCRALSATRNLVVEQKMALGRSMLEGFQLAFEGGLDSSSTKAVGRVLQSYLGRQLSRSEIDHPPRKPSRGSQNYALLKPFWLKAGPLEPVDFSEGTLPGRSKFILTESMSLNLRRLARAVAAGSWPVLLEGPTSAGKTTLVEYLAARCGHDVVRINNHEHTDIQEYTGGYSSDANGSLSFHDGILVRALRRGHWVILDELNLAPSEVLEALNRLLDDNRELYLPEIDEAVKPHPNFRLFATQNPSGAYGGRKPLSRAFRNRFVEVHMGDIPTEEMKIILEKRCACPPSHAKTLVKIMVALRQRRNAHGVFLGKDGLITPRDLLRWAERGGSSKLALAQEGYMLLAERLRSEDEKAIVKEEIESHLGVTIDCDEIYYGDNSEARALLVRTAMAKGNSISSLPVAPTRSLLRVLTLVIRCVRHREPVLLVGETGCGKTTVVQFLSDILDRKLHVVNCHATTETSDLIGGLRPVRGRRNITLEIRRQFQNFISLYPAKNVLESISLPWFLGLAGIKGERSISIGDADFSNNDVADIVSLLDVLVERLNRSGSSVNVVADKSKKRKLTSGISLDVGCDGTLDAELVRRLRHIAVEIKALASRLSSLFEWVDGPLVHAMQLGQLLLLDEMSLAEDAVLERLNSVLEPSRTLVIAEKSTSQKHESDGGSIVAHENFGIFATMNPGGDFGKRELSPALRSRFTEIWVPQVTDPSDIEMVLSHSLAPAAVRCEPELLTAKILNYVNYFNVSICGSNSASPYADLALSLRDVLAWARFIVDVSKLDESMDLWALYFHGACLMHLDGLGLGTGLSLNEAADAKRQSISFLLNEVPLEERAASEASFRGDLRKGIVAEKRFGIHPFTIPTGTFPIPERAFDFEAPTPSMNLLRVLRAMQISKPILLEGSPGVGKTSLAAALASASGHRLVRINLSEQTDMSDLMGTDLPIPDSESDDNNENSTSGSSFKWCDGVLLRAIKRGDWVLLDELNLASQAVLEGLNSCLDHRANVYIPELGRTFQCPSTFRIFAAQNPLAQGGGRKGLPKSFLNRFTKVYVDALTNDDLSSIIFSRFPEVEVALVKSMILFNNRVHDDVVVRREYGYEGSPWEFNLRDLFRWCELVVGSGTISEEQLARFARDIYLQRFRTPEDRMRLDGTYREFFRKSLFDLSLPELTVTGRRITIGGATLDRRIHCVDTLTGELSGEDAVVIRSLLCPLEAVANCVTMKWPCLVVGTAGSGKSSLVKSLSELCNVPLINVSLTPATDVNELVGSFEQVDCRRDRMELTQSLRLLSHAACTCLTRTAEQISLLRQLTRLRQSLHDASLREATEIGLQLDSLLQLACNLSDEFQQCACEHLSNFRVSMRRLQAVRSGEMERSRQHFRWVDGVLVTAMTRGYWLHLENANLCPASVLDRLNPLMEQDGELLLTECGVQDSDTHGSNHRVVRQHPNFRIFLSMNPENGEVSRAMRNRCVEVSLIAPSTKGATSKAGNQDVDCQDLLYSTGIRSMQLASLMADIHDGEVEDSNCLAPAEVSSKKQIREWGRLAIGLSIRGVDAQSSIEMSCRLSCELCKEEARLRLQRTLPRRSDMVGSAAIQSPSLRWGYSFSPDQARVDSEMRVIKHFTSHDFPVQALKDLLSFVDTFSENADGTGFGSCDGLDFEGHSRWYSALRNNLLSLFLGKSTVSDMTCRSQSLDGFNDATSDSLRFMASLLQTAVTKSFQSGGFDGLESASDQFASNVVNSSAPSLQVNRVLTLLLRRLDQLLAEQEIQRRIALSDGISIPSKRISALETSMYLYQGTINRALVSCPATPMLYPLFIALDEWVNHLLAVPEIVNWTTYNFQQLVSFLSRRDQLWLCLQQSPYAGISPSRLLGFDESGFVVQWIWLKKRLSVFPPAADKNDKKLQLDVLIEGLDRILFDTGDDLFRSADVFWKKGGHPLVPRKASQWEAIAELYEASWSCTLLQEPSATAPIELRDLVDHSTPAIFLNPTEKRELLAALSMCFWTSTDEVPSAGGSRSRPLLETGQLCAAMSEQLKKGRQTFEAQVSASRIDTDIATVENLQDVEALSTLREKAGMGGASDSGGAFLRSLLFRFAQIQVSPLAEFWCVLEEVSLVGTLARIIVAAPDPETVLNDLKSLLPRVRGFIDVVLSLTGLAVTDIRPYHTLVWAVGDSGVEAGTIIHLMRCLFPRMMYALSCHKWSNSFNDLDVISGKLEMPPLRTSDQVKRSETNDSTQNRDWSKELRRGPPGLHRFVKSEVILRLIGSDVSSIFSTACKSMYATIENYSARRKQAQVVLRMLATLRLPSDERHEQYLVQYSLCHLVGALSNFFPGSSGEELLSILKDPKAMKSVEEEHLSGLFAKCEHPAFRACFESVVPPLVASLLSMFKLVSVQENQAICWIYVGLLQLSLLVPCSTLDPGTKPATKSRELDRHLGTLNGKIVAMRLDSLFVRGIAIPEDPTYHQLVEEVKLTEGKRAKQERKKVERVASAPPFVDLFRELRRFFLTTVAQEGIQDLVRSITQAGQDKRKISSVRNREYSWQATSGSFCAHITSKFAAYEDVTIPFVNAVQNVRDGIRLLSERHLLSSPYAEQWRGSIVQSLFAFPAGNLFSDSGIYASGVSIVDHLAVPGSATSAELKRCRFAYSLALLYRFDLQRRLRAGKLALPAVMESHLVFCSATSTWCSQRDGTTRDAPVAAEALLEEEYREQFPDHGEEFQALLRMVEMGEDVDLRETEHTEQSDTDWRLTDDEMEVLCSLHRDLFSREVKPLDDQRRTRGLYAAYSAAYHFAQVGQMPSPHWSNDFEQLGSHIAALSLRSVLSPDVHQFDCDFHRGANPTEVAKASRPLELLIGRTSQLLSAFPGHSVLVALVRVADRVRRLPLSTTSIGKAMSGLELILRKAQEWEQHASTLVKLGTPLRDVSELVARWRKLELQSWETLLNSRELRFEKRARRHWPRLYGVLVNGVEQKGEHRSHQSNPSHRTVDAPAWVWKGLPAKMGLLCASSSYHEEDEQLRHLSKVMDTFFLNSSLGEFKERLDLVETFASQISLMNDHCWCGDRAPSKVARMLFSLLSYYGQFAPMLDSRLSDLRNPLEARLRDEVKLAKWDEQSYYALRDSIERNHRKLMKLLREYDDVLEVTVSSILEKQLCHGVRAVESSAAEPCSSIPTYKLMFPLVAVVGISSEPRCHVPNSSRPLLAHSRKWADPEKAGLACDKFVSRMGHYGGRMVSLLERESPAWSQIGSKSATSLCESIFERIETLRRVNTTKTMKQRALVDLFKALKQNGFLYSKRSIPEGVREMAQLLQLPPLVHRHKALSVEESVILEGTQRYFQRTTAEVNQLRSEVLMLGRTNMSQRETQIMLSLVEHGLTILCQQRCVLAGFLDQFSCLDELTHDCETWCNLPLNQTGIRKTLEDYNDAVLSAKENLKEQQLLARAALPLVEEPARQDIRDVISVLDSCVSSLDSHNEARMGPVLTRAAISCATDKGQSLKEVEELVCSCRRTCENSISLPSEVFSSCISEIQRARSICSRLSDDTVSRDIDNEAKASIVMDSASLLVQKVLLAVQVLCKDHESEGQDTPSEESFDESIFACHALASKELAIVDLHGVIEATTALIESLRLLHESDVVAKLERDCCTSVVSGASILVRTLLDATRQRLVEYIHFSRNVAKLNYILVRVFRVLVSNGYCADNMTGDEDGEGDASGMNFEDDENGTGMGKGEGINDVTDQLESEEQLLGLKGEDADENTLDDKVSRELNEEEAKQGMEMEGDFAGEMFDVPEETQDDNERGDENEEELDREMGDGPDQNEDIIDEKMWDGSDEEVDQNPAEEKFEKDSGVQGEMLEDELRTRDGEEADKENTSSSKDSKKAQRSEDGTDNIEEELKAEPEINEDSEDKYEEKASGVDVRDGKENADGDGDDDEDPMELEDDLNLDENSAAGANECDNAMNTEENDGIEPTTEEGSTANADSATEDGDGGSDSESSEVCVDRFETGGYLGENDQTGQEITEGLHDDETQMPDVEFSEYDASNDVQGIQSKDGKDRVTETTEDDDDDYLSHDNEGEGEKNEDEGNASESQQSQAVSGGKSGEGGDVGEKAEPSSDRDTDTQKNSTKSAPSPFESPGDATKFWHKKLQMLDDDHKEDENEATCNHSEENHDSSGEFEYTSQEQASTTQVLGMAEEEDASRFDDKAEGQDDSENQMERETKPPENEEISPPTDKRRKSKSARKKNVGDLSKAAGEQEKEQPDAGPLSDDEMENYDTQTNDDETANDTREAQEGPDLGNRIVADLSQLSVNGAISSMEDRERSSLIEEDTYTKANAADVAAARSRWSTIQGETHHLARRLCEKLRLVMEPLVATKLKGDYRTGKRINMKRVIGYIASGYRKDKIWLRRTKPAKRNYRVLLAVDNSESMHRSGAGNMALAAMATLAVGMSQLEIGELGVASFGEEMKLLHPFHKPFTSESGVSVVQNFPFDERRTRTALCVESAMSALESQGHVTAMQLVFLISDGRIERDSRDELRRLVREMVERNILLVMIIVEGGDKNGQRSKKDSIIHMKEVTFKNGKPNVKLFIEDYPFPYYMVLEDMQSLPELLGDALRQWFEMLAQLQGSSR